MKILLNTGDINNDNTDLLKKTLVQLYISKYYYKNNFHIYTVETVHERFNNNPILYEDEGLNIEFSLDNVSEDLDFDDIDALMESKNLRLIEMAKDDLIKGYEDRLDMVWCSNEPISTIKYKNIGMFKTTNAKDFIVKEMYRDDINLQNFIINDEFLGKYFTIVDVKVPEGEHYYITKRLNLAKIGGNSEQLIVGSILGLEWDDRLRYTLVEDLKPKLLDKLFNVEY